MRANIWRLLAIGLGLALATGCGETAETPATTNLLTIGTGGVTGVYYPTGGAIAKLLNRRTAEHGMKMTAESTAGSVFNVNQVLAGEMDFGLVQSDRQYQAYHGQAEWRERGPQRDLRAVCSLHPEAVTLVATEASGIRTLADLRGKRVNLGNPGSGQRGNSLDVLGAVGLDWERDLTGEGIAASSAPQELQDGRLDAFFYTVGHPAGAITQATAGIKHKVRFVPITGMESLLREKPYYAAVTIPIRLYDQALNDEDVATIGVMTTLVTSAEMPEEVVYALTKAIFDNLEDLRRMHPALEVLTPAGMLQGLSAPLHPGALKYFREAGLAVQEE